MILYHGTTKAAAEKILLEGLKPNRDDAFQIGRDDRLYTLRDVEGNDPVLYVTRLRDHAEDFAKFRTEYAMAFRGDEVNFLGWYPFRKLTARRVDHAEPPILEIELPDTQYWKSKLHEDPQDSENYIHEKPVSFICQCSIPPAYIRMAN